VAILATDGFEDRSSSTRVKALADQGAITVIVSTHAGEIQGYKHDVKGTA